MEKIGSWQEIYENHMTDRVKKLREYTVQTPGICLEHAFAEMKVYKETEGKNVPRITERALVFKTYLEDRTIFLEDGDLLAGNVTSKHRASPWFGEMYNVFAEQELGDPKHDPQVRPHDRHIITDEERKILKETIFPFFRGKTFEEYLYAKAEGDVADKGFAFTASCPHIPNQGDLLVRQDAGHMFCNYEKVLRKGFKGIREEILFNRKECAESYSSFNRKERLEWYDAALMCVDAAIAHAKKFSALAAQKAEEEKDPTRAAELREISRICAKVPENPAESWYEALQSVWFTHMCTMLEQCNYGNSFGRFDQYMYPYYKTSVLDKKEMTRDQALELLECFWIKLVSFTEMYDYNTALVQTGFPLSQNLIIGGMLPDGTDGCNEVTMLCLEADMETAVFQPELAMRVWEGTPTKYLRKALEVVRLGRGKPKFYGDRTALEMLKQAYPLVDEKDLADYACIGCIEIGLPYITQNNSFTGLQNIGKIMELTLNDGKCAICGKQIGPHTGDPRTFKSIEALKQAFRTQTFYWMECMAKAMKVEMECQGERLQLPFSSTLLEGPIQKGVDVMQCGTWYTKNGILVGGTANAADSFAAIDTLVFKKKTVTMDELVTACLNNWDGKEELRQICINECPKYGNDDDYADAWAAFVANTWYDAIDYINNDKSLAPKFGGEYSGAVLIGNGAVGMGRAVSGLPNGHKFYEPLADTWAPVQGADVNGADAVIRSVAKMPANRYQMGTALNQRLTPQMLATDEDIDKFVDYMRTCEKLGIYHIQFNVISSEALKRAIKEPEKYKDLLVRVASYVAYYVDLDTCTQQDIINRTEQTEW